MALAWFRMRLTELFIVTSPFPREPAAFATTFQLSLPPSLAVRLVKAFEACRFATFPFCPDRVKAWVPVMLVANVRVEL